jgi:hypothetical protein
MKSARNIKILAEAHGFGEQFFLAEESQLFFTGALSFYFLALSGSGLCAQSAWKRQAKKRVKKGAVEMKLSSQRVVHQLCVSACYKSWEPTVEEK